MLKPWIVPNIDMSAHYSGHRERLRQRILKGPKSLADYELLELVLAACIPRKDTKPLAKELIERFGSLRGVLLADKEVLKDVPGIGPGTLALWEALKEIRARIGEEGLADRQVIRNQDQVVEAAQARLGHLAHEEFWVVLLDTKFRVLSWRELSRGTVDKTAVYVRELMSLALRHKAKAMILVHNHPGGDPTPSEQDLELTRRISRAAMDLDIRVLDHIVVSDKKYFSFQENGFI